MIIIFSKQGHFLASVSKHLKDANPQQEVLSVSDYQISNLNLLYNDKLKGLIIDRDFSPLPEQAWADLLMAAAKRIPVIICNMNAVAMMPRHLLNTEVIWLNRPSPEEIRKIVLRNSLRYYEGTNQKNQIIPLYNQLVPIQMLKKHGSLATIAIDGSGLHDLVTKYGRSVYLSVQTLLKEILQEMWGTTGNFRKTDFLMRRSGISNDYLLFLQPNRSANAIPGPGIMEKLTQRLAMRIQLTMWEELLNDHSSKRIPHFVSSVPQLAVGYDIAINNPCIEPEDIIEKTVSNALANAKAQHTYLINKERELMVSFIKTPGVLYSNYQAVFWMENLTKEHLEESKRQNSILPLARHLYGFEALIRVSKDSIPQAIFKNSPLYMNDKALRPDILFSLAKTTRLTLEFDQACLTQALKFHKSLPGYLLINILPRNLYFIEKLLPNKKYEKVIFEVSESEEIANFDLTMEIKEKLLMCDMGLAADDFGRGHTSLERILKVKPQIIKLDRSLIEDIHLDKSKYAFVLGLIKATSANKGLIIAEGIELWDEFCVLKEMGVQLAQGFLLHNPSHPQQIIKELFQEGSQQSKDEEDDLSDDKLTGAA